jgi:Zn-dependent protease
MNLVLAVIAAFVFITVFRTSFNSTFTPSVLSRVVVFFGLANIGLMAFNLIPIPPLDGSVLFERALPARYWPGYLRIRPYTMYIVLGLVLLNFYVSIHGTGPITWAIFHLYNWWLGLLGADLRFG